MPLPFRFPRVATALCALAALTAFLPSPARATYALDGLTGDVTQHEADSFIATIQGVTIYPSEWSYKGAEGHNYLADGTGGLDLRAINLMYQLCRSNSALATEQTQLMNLSVQWAEVWLTHRNDQPAGDGRVMWTGNVDLVWPPNPPDGSQGSALYAGCEVGETVGILADVALNIFTTPALWNQTVPDGNPNGYGTTYLQRAQTYDAMLEQSMDEYFNAYFFNSTTGYIQAPTSSVWLSFNENVNAWNRGFMFMHAYQSLAQIHRILGDNAVKAAEYQQAVVNWSNLFAQNAKPKTAPDGASVYDWGYGNYGDSLGNLTDESTSHGSFDMEGLCHAFQLSGAYTGVTWSTMATYASTALHEVREGSRLYSQSVDRAAGTTQDYLQQEWLSLVPYNVSMFAPVVQDNQTAGAITGSNGALNTAIVLWDKHWIYSHSAGQADLSAAFNRLGIVGDGSTFTGGLDGAGDAYSANALGSVVTANGVTFNLGDVQSPNAISGTGQTVSLTPGQYGSFNLLATGVNGSQVDQTFVVTYTDGTTAAFTQSLSDWGTSQGYPGETVAATMTYDDGAGGSPGTQTVNLYAYAFSIDSSRTVRSVTLPNNGNVEVLAITLSSGIASTPAIWLPSGTYTGAQTVMITSSTIGASIYYTLDGSTPTAATGTLYTGPVSIPTGAVLTAIAIAPGYASSAVVGASYTITAEAPTFSPAPGTYPTTQYISLASGSPGTSIRYTTDGSMPSETAGTVYAQPIRVAQAATINAIVYGPGYADSAISSGAYAFGITPAQIVVPASAVTASKFTTGYPPSNTVDNNLSTRWAASGNGVTITYPLGALDTVNSVKIAWYDGTTRTYTFDIQVSTDNVNWTTMVTGMKSSGKTTALETYTLTPVNAAYVRIVGHESSADAYTNITELQMWGTTPYSRTSVAASPTVTYSANAQTVALTAGVSLSAGTVNAGSVTFSLLHGSTVVGTPVSAPVSAGSASANYSLPGGSGAGTYTIEAAYGGIGSFPGSTAEDGTLTVVPAAATVTLSNLNLFYNGSPEGATVTTSPANVAVAITYNGSPTPPTLPGTYAVQATVSDPNYTGTASGTLAITTTALVKAAPVLSANAMLDGSLQMLSGANVSLSGQASISGDLLVPGTPTFVVSGTPTYAGVQTGPGSASPTNYTVTLSGSAVLRYLVEQINPGVLPSVTAPSPNSNNLVYSGSGAVTLPPGSYGAVTVNGASLTLGVAGSSSSYTFQSLTVTGGGSISLAGPTSVVVASKVLLNGNVGNPTQASLLTLAVANGGVTLNSGATVGASIVAPNGTVIINSNCSVYGSVAASGLSISGTGLLSGTAQH